jgi:hypothetical protein
MIRWSATKISDASSCTRKILYHNVLHYPRDLTSAIVGGLYVHSGCRKVLDGDEKRHFKSAQTYASARTGSFMRCIAKPQKYGKTPIRVDIEDELYLVAHTVVRPCSENFYEQFNGKRPAGVEKWFSIQLGKFILRGAFDVINPTKSSKLSFLDFKTGYKMPSMDNLRNDWQFTIYSAALPIIAGQDEELADRLKLNKSQRMAARDEPLSLIEDVVGVYSHLRSGESREIRKKKQDLIELLNEMESLSWRIEHGDFAHNRGRHCHWCLARTKCDNDRDNGVVYLQEQAARNPHGTFFPTERDLTLHTELPQVAKLIPSKGKKSRKDNNTYLPMFVEIMAA